MTRLSKMIIYSLFLFLSTVQSENVSTTISPTTDEPTTEEIEIKPCPCPKISEVTENNCPGILECMRKNIDICYEVDGARLFLSNNCSELYLCDQENYEYLIAETAAKKRMSVDQFKLTLPRDNDTKRNEMLITPQCVKDLSKEEKSFPERCKNASPVDECVKLLYKKEKCYKVAMKDFAETCKLWFGITVDLDGNGKETRGFALNYFAGIVIALLML